MSRKEQSTRFSMRKQKTYLTAGVIALAAVIAMAGIYYKRASNEKAEEQEAVIMAENEWADEEAGDSSESETFTSDDGTSDAGETTDDTTDGAGSGLSGSGASQSAALTSGQAATADIEGTMETSVETSAAAQTEPQFSEADTLGWPISGNILMNYSMDQTVYFATLDQYKYNPALVIEGAVNDKVTAAADGTVLSVETTAETGETVSVDIGGGFQLIYGQLKDVQVSPGDTMEKGALIGFISEPTKYYSVEGSNLYFAMLKDGEPVNPMNYLE